ncbi:hypothetical protein MLD38_004101 [Melastoma candidum]|uniref:Uncharacterized protein n=1 Tax=Melastoma candidum TaxID=119954 RepID=A0ACB9S6K5_9MYRT|nr:hypothetical protein MLD38_004101 [Melastoma candidum]
MMLRLLCYFLLVTCYLGQATGGFPAQMARIAATPDERNKKVIADILGLAVDDDMVLKKQGGGKSTRWELREIPLGPNPMHHHGNGPMKKPQTP